MTANPALTASIVMRSDETWSDILTFVTSLDERERDTVRSGDGWSVKDHIAHLGAWKRSFVCWLEGRSGHGALRVSEALFLADDLDAINAASRDAWANEPWHRVLADAGAAHDAWMTAIASLDEAALSRALGRRPVATTLPDITWVHDLEHLGWMHAHLGRMAPMETLSPEKQERDRLIAEGHRLLDEVIAFGESLSPAARSVVLTAEGWTIIDHLTHLAAWIRYAVDEIGGSGGARWVDLTSEEFTAMVPDYDGINVRIHARYAGTSWDDAVTSFRSAVADFDTLLSRASTAELATVVMWKETLLGVYHDFAIHHVGEHLGWMREQVAASGFRSTYLRA